MDFFLHHTKYASDLHLFVYIKLSNVLMTPEKYQVASSNRVRR